MPNDVILYLLSWAVFYTGFPMPDELPTVEIVEHAYFVEKICKGVDTKRKPCMARGMYNDKETGRIYLNEKFAPEITDEIEATIVHEMVHYLQDKSEIWINMDTWQEDILCQERVFREKQAYKVQRRYLIDVHSIILPPRRYYDKCEKE